MPNPITSADRLTGFVEGSINARQDMEASMLPTFRRMVILETISDPANLDTKKIDYWKAIYKISNSQWLRFAPRNSVIATEIKSNTNPLLVFPFFPSHLAMPCKAGECIWTMFEDPNAENPLIAYWFCKIAEFSTIDDVNHTHPVRGKDASKGSSLITLSQNNGVSDAWYELRNGDAVNSEQDGRTTKSETFFIKGREDIFESLVTQTDASKITQYEAVPRFKKRPADLVFEGSNNTLIVLGTDRVGSIAEYDIDPDAQIAVPNNPARDFHSGSAGSIDIVAGRGQTANTLGNYVSTTSIYGATPTAKGIEIKKELEKSIDKISQSEGDPDYLNDRSRILIAQKTSPDINFGLANYNRTNYGIEDDVNGDSAIVIKSDKVRLIARSDLQIIVKNFESDDSASGNKNEDGSNEKIKFESFNESLWASITVRSNGDIIFKPSDTGYIKLGGDDATKAMICTDYNATLNNGQVTATGPANAVIVTTDGSSFGSGAANQGQVATKILVK